MPTQSSMLAVLYLCLFVCVWAVGASPPQAAAQTFKAKVPAARNTFKQAIGLWKTTKGAIMSIYEDEDNGTLTCVTQKPARDDVYEGGPESMFFTNGKANGNTIVTERGYAYFYLVDVKQWKIAGLRVPPPYSHNHFELTLSPNAQKMEVHMLVQRYHPTKAFWATYEGYGERCREAEESTWTRVSDNSY